MSNSSKYKPLYGKGFTLVEVLIVLVIVALLAALALPAFQKARARMQLAGCQSNLHQIGVALNLYLGEHNGMFPGPLTGAQPVKYTKNSTNALAMHLAPYMGLEVDSKTRVSLCFVCPVYKNQVDAGVRTYGIALQDCDYPFGYSQPASSGKSSRDPVTIQALQVRRANKDTWLLKDTYQSSSQASSYLPTEPEHGQVANFLFIDGSVRVLPVDYTAQ